MARLYEAGWRNTPLPGSGMALSEYSSWVEMAATERAAGRLPHLRLSTHTPDPPPAVPLEQDTEESAADSGRDGGGEQR